MKTTLTTAALLALISLSADLAQATTTLIYNSTGTVSGSYEISSSYAGGPLAGEFLSGNAPATISFMEIFLEAPAEASSGTITISLYSDANGPGTLLSTIGTISNVPASTSASYVAEGFESSYQLAANTEYWIKLSSTDTEWNWQYTDQDNGVGTAGQDVYWDGSVLYSQAWDYDMEIFTTTTDASAASPEPATLALCGLSCLCLAAPFRRRRRPN
jgi:hypothetical protein